MQKNKTEIVNLKNREGQNKFKVRTSKPGILSDIFKDEKRHRRPHKKVL